MRKTSLKRIDFVELAYHAGVADGRRLERRAMQRAATEDMRNGETISRRMYRRLWKPRTKPAKRKAKGGDVL